MLRLAIRVAVGTLLGGRRCLKVRGLRVGLLIARRGVVAPSLRAGRAESLVVEWISHRILHVRCGLVCTTKILRAVVCSLSHRHRAGNAPYFLLWCTRGWVLGLSC